MKHKTPIKLVILCFLIFSTVYSFAQKQSQNKYFELENGLKVYLLERHTLPLLNITAAINLGSKDETDKTNGLVHILEHSILFGGTELRSGSEVREDIRRHGAYFNAHTDHDLVTFDISLPSEYADFALQNQKEILFNLKLLKEEVDKEKKVILEEIAQTKDDPLRYASSLIYQNLYKNHSYQNPVIGREENIKAATTDQIAEFYRKFFVPSNCVLAVVGEFNIEEMEEKVKNIFGDLKKEEFSPLKYKKVAPLQKTIEIEKEMDVNQAYLLIGMTGPDYNHPDQYLADLLVQILGRGFNPMLGYALRGRRKLVHSISMLYTAQKYGGAILIILTLEPKHLKSAKNAAISYLKKTRSERYSKADFLPGEEYYVLDFLECAKNQIKFDFYKSREKGLSVANSLARFMLLSENNKKGTYLENLEKSSSSDLRKAASKYLSKGKYVIVSILPKNKK